MTIWRPELTKQKGPRYLAITEALAEDIRSARLADGARLPTHREWTLIFDQCLDPDETLQLR